jgi:hypothetical protein
MKLHNKLYCELCHKRVDNFTDPKDIYYYYDKDGTERHYCKEHGEIGELKLYEIFENPKYTEMLKDIVDRTLQRNKIKRIYEDDDFIIDLIAADTPTVRVSIFKDNHFQDEVIIRKDDYCG